MNELSYHIDQCRVASELYSKNLDSEFEAACWRQELNQARGEVENLLRVSDELAHIEGALMQSGRYAKVLRFLLAPPLSQDQFALASLEWKKGTEKLDRPLSSLTACKVAEDFREWMDEERIPSIPLPANCREKAISTTASLMAMNQYRTARRMRLAHRQEKDVIQLLRKMGYEQVSRPIIDEPGVLNSREYMHATKFATADGSTHEVDIAIGLPGRKILALECKVSNDRTNSIKRVNDVLKKASAWSKQWGSFVKTGAVLEGVFGDSEPRRMLEVDVSIFWSHDLDRLEKFLTDQ